MHLTTFTDIVELYDIAREHRQESKLHEALYHLLSQPCPNRLVGHGTQLTAISRPTCECGLPFVWLEKGFWSVEDEHLRIFDDRLTAYINSPDSVNSRGVLQGIFTYALVASHHEPAPRILAWDLFWKGTVTDAVESMKRLLEEAVDVS